MVEQEKLMEVWREYYDKLSNEEFPCYKVALSEVGAVSGPCEEISFEEVRAAVKKMKNSKAAGPTGVVADMLKATGDAGSIWATDVCNSC